MYTEICLEQRTPEWHEYRSMHIGSSDAPIIMGVSPWTNVKQLYKEKLGLRNRSISTAMRRGIESEDLARDFFKIEMGISVRPIVIESKDNPWMCASLDGISEDGQIVEIKRAGDKDHNLALQGFIPKHYFPQLQHIIYVSGVSFIWYYSFIGSSGIAIKCPRNDDYIKTMIGKEKEFYDNLMRFEGFQFENEEYTEQETEEWDVLAKKYKSQFLEAKEYEALLKQKLEDIEITKKLIVELSMGKNSKGSGISLKKSTRKGLVDYSKIPQLEGVDLEMYRKESTSTWKIEVDKDFSG